MRTPTLALTTAALLVTSVAHAQTARIGRCHMGECGWTRELSRDFIGTSPRGTLVKLQLLRGTSTNPRGGPASKRPVKWEKTPGETFVFCSKTLPAVMFTLDGEFSAHLLDLFPGAHLPGYQEASLALYMDVCHNVNVNQKYEDPKVYVERFKYEGDRTRYRAVEEAVKQPTDILKQ